MGPRQRPRGDPIRSVATVNIYLLFEIKWEATAML